MRVRAATPVLLVLLMTACAGPLGAPSRPLGIVVITAGGVAIDDGATGVPTTLDLRVTAARALAAGEVTATLDGKPLDARTAGDSASASTAPMQLASHHTLFVEIDGERHDIAFQVIGLAGVAGAEHLDPSGSVVADIVFQYEPVRSAVAAVISGGTWSDARHLRLNWSPATVPAEIALPSSLPVKGGSHLVSDFAMPLTPVPPPGTLRRVTIGPVAVKPQRVLAFVVSTAASHASAQANVSRVARLAPTGWNLEASGLSGAPDAVTVSVGAAASKQVWPLVQNDASQAVSLAHALSDPSKRLQLAAQVSAAVTAGGYPGINLDIEALGGGSRDDYTKFVTSLAGLLHKQGKKIAVDVVGHRPGHVTDFSAMFDAPGLRDVADDTILMAYDEHTDTDSPGPVAGLDWDQELIRGTFGGGPLPDVWLGLPLYARIWSTDGTTSTSYADAVSTALQQTGAVVDYDFDAATPYIRVNSSLTYFDDADSLARKASIAESHHMAGLAVWRLGFEDPGFWSLAASQ